MSQEDKHLEIERRWLLSGLPKAQICKLKRVACHDSFYLTGDCNPEIRFKRIAPLRLPIEMSDRFRPLKASYSITVKSGEGIVRRELIISDSNILNERNFLLCGNFLRRANGKRFYSIKKSRFKIRLAKNIVWEIDEFRGHLLGLFMAEIEFSSLDKARAVLILEWLNPLIIKEVTNDPRYYNKTLAVHGMPNPV